MQGSSIERLLLLCFLASCVDLDVPKPVSVVVIPCPPPSPQDMTVLFDAFQEITHGWNWRMHLPLPNDLILQSGGGRGCNETWLARTIEEAVVGREVDAVLSSGPSTICHLSSTIAPTNVLFFTSACPEDVSPFGTSVALLATAEAVAHLTRRYNWRSVILLYSDSSWWSSLADRIHATLLDILPPSNVLRLPVDDFDDQDRPDWASVPTLPLALFQQKGVDVVVVCGSHLLARLPQGLPPEVTVLVTRIAAQLHAANALFHLHPPLLLYDTPCINHTQALRCWMQRSLEAARLALQPNAAVEFSSSSQYDAAVVPDHQRRPHALYTLKQCQAGGGGADGGEGEGGKEGEEEEGEEGEETEGEETEGEAITGCQGLQLEKIYSFETAFRTGGDGLNAGKATSLAGREVKIGTLYVSLYALVAASGIGFFAVCLWLTLKKKNDE